MSGAMKLCPRCRKAEIQALREKKWHQPNWHRSIFEHSLAVGISRMVLWVLAYEADRFGICSVPRDVIATRCLCRPQTVTSSIASLIAERELGLVREQSGRSAAVYRILLPARFEARRAKHQPDFIDP